MARQDLRRHFLVQEIRAAFLGAQRPKSAGLFRVDFAELNEGEAVFGGKDWRELSVPELRAHGGLLPVMTPVAFRFFLPAYLMAVVERPIELDMGYDDLMYALELPASAGGERKARLEQFAALDSAQKECVQDVLEHLTEEHNVDSRPRRALESYWHRSENSPQDR